MSLVPCMGGWCNQRDKCANYTAPPIPGRQPVERLCGKTEEPEQLARPLTTGEPE